MAGDAADIRSGRLGEEELERGFSDLHEPLSRPEALIAADRCYFCYDAPCTTACPTGIDIPGFIQKIRSDNVEGSAQTILRENIMPEYLDVSRRELAETWPETRLVAFGHVGDGNLHYNVALPGDWSAERQSEEGSAITRRVYELATDMGGSFSAEHGVGRTKRDVLASFADPVSLGLMRTLKQALDPRGILNPGKVI